MTECIAWKAVCGRGCTQGASNGNRMGMMRLWPTPLLDGWGGGMKQSRAMSLVESVANVVVGYGVSVVTQMLIFPIFGLHATLAQNLKLGAVFTLVSIARSYALRRLFEQLR